MQDRPRFETAFNFVNDGKLVKFDITISFVLAKTCKFIKKYESISDLLVLQHTSNTSQSQPTKK